MLKNNFRKNILVLFSGTVLSQIIPILFLPILTRIFSPNQFGEYSLFIAITTILIILVTAKYELAIHLPKSLDKARRILNLTIFISLVISLVIFISLTIIISIWNRYSNNEVNLSFIFFIVISILMMGIYYAYYQYLSRINEYKILGINKIIKQLFIGFATVGLSVFTTHYMLIIGLIISQLIATLFLVRYTYKKDPDYKFKLEFKEFKMILKEYKDFPKFQIPTQLLNTGNFHLITLIFGVIFSSTIIGLYSLAQRMLRFPMVIIGHAITDVFRQRAAKDFNEFGNCKKIYLTTLKLLTMTGIPVFIVIFIFAPSVFGIMFGQDWYAAGEFVRYLLPMLLMQYIFSPLNAVFIIFNKQNVELYWQVFMMVFSIITITFAYLISGKAEIIILSYSLVNAMSYLVVGLLTFKIVCNKS